MSRTARGLEIKTYVPFTTHTLNPQTGELEPTTQGERKYIAETCSRHASNLCTMVATGAAGLAAAAAALILAGAATVMIGDMARGGGTRKAKKSNRKRRATRRI